MSEKKFVRAEQKSYISLKTLPSSFLSIFRLKGFAFKFASLVPLRRTNYFVVSDPFLCNYTEIEGCSKVIYYFREIVAFLVRSQIHAMGFHCATRLLRPADADETFRRCPAPLSTLILGPLGARWNDKYSFSLMAFVYVMALV